MSPDEVKALRTRLGCTAKELARVLDVEPAEIGAWERGELFPTKRFVDRLKELDKQGPKSVPRLRAKRSQAADPLVALADPEVWTLVRKLLAHPELREAVAQLADRFDDPATS